MGSSHSHLTPSNNPNDRQQPSATANDASSATRPRPSSSTSRLSSLRRLSTLGSIGRRHSDQNGKRGRQGSSSTSVSAPEQDLHEGVQSKKQKRFESGPGSRSTSPAATSIPPLAPALELTEANATPPGPSSQSQTPLSPSGLSNYPQPTAGPSVQQVSPPASISLPSSAPLSPPLLSPTSDPLAEERLQSISTIRDALGPTWPNEDSARSPAVDRLLHRFRRSSSFPPPPPSLSPSAQTPPQRTMSDRLTALLGLTNLADSPSSSQPPSPATAPSSELPPEPAIDELQRRLQHAREELTETHRQLDEARERVEAARRRPSGAVLVIQGLAQTQTQEDSNPARPSDSSQTTAIGSDHPSASRARRASESHASQASDPPESHNGSSLETQARMIGGLLT